MAQSPYIRCFKQTFLPLHRTFKRLVFIFSTLIAIMFTYHYLTMLNRQGAKLAVQEPTSIVAFSTPRSSLKNHTALYSIIEPDILPLKMKETYILVIISSSAKGRHHFERREAIRKTWGYYSEKFANEKQITGFSWRLVFMMGKSENISENRLLLKEAEANGDIIHGDYVDVYGNITAKLLMAFKWASSQQFKFLLKTDDDVYVNMPRLIFWLQNPFLPEKLYAGVTHSGSVERNPNHRHYVPVDDYSPDYFPTFCKGSMYLLSSQVLKDIVQVSYYIKPIGIDDAYVGILADEINVKPYSLSDFVQREYSSIFVDLLNSCQYKEVIGLGDGLNAHHLFYIHQKVQDYQNTSNLFCLKISPSLSFIHFSIAAMILFILWIVCTKKGSISISSWKSSGTSK